LQATARNVQRIDDSVFQQASTELHAGRMRLRYSCRKASIGSIQAACRAG
jgi:hypothetical protein